MTTVEASLNINLPPASYTPPSLTDTVNEAAENGNNDRLGDNAKADNTSRSRKKRGVADPTNLWPQNYELTISLARLSDFQKEKVREGFAKFAPHVNLRFTFVDSDDADIILESTRGKSSSAIGTAAEEFPIGKATIKINFWDIPQHDILHEIGHTIGLKHEHQHPDRTVNYNRQALLPIFGDNESAYDHNMNIYDPDKHVTSRYDPKSIMHYYVPPGYSTGGDTTSLNTELSQGDKDFLEQLYPPDRDPNSLVPVKLTTHSGSLTHHKYSKLPPLQPQTS